MKYNEALQEAGVLIALDGLHPPSMGARVSFKAGKPLVTDGPFAEAKEVLGGYWMINVTSREEAIAWAKRCPASENEIIEIRQVQEMSDFPEEVQQAAGFADLQRAMPTVAVSRVIPALSARPCPGRGAPRNASPQSRPRFHRLDHRWAPALQRVLRPRCVRGTACFSGCYPSAAHPSDLCVRLM